MADRLFRFGVVAAAAADAGQWAGLARRAEELGYSTFLTPDTLNTLPPLLALSAAASATTSIGLGTFVLAVPYRRPEQVAWEVAGLGFLSGGRFELGLGVGRPDAREDSARLGVPFGTHDQRIRQLEEMIRQVRKWPPMTGTPGQATGGGPRPAIGRTDGRVTDGHATDAQAAGGQAPEAHATRSQATDGQVAGSGPRVLVAASGARTLGFAARNADTVAIALPASTPEDGLAEPVKLLRQAGDDFDRLEISAGLHAVGDDIPPWLARQLGPDVPDDSVAVLRGTPRQMADRLLRRRDLHEVSYITVNAMYADRLAPVVELLAGT
ncbi:LLM class flavin-dependent oxidoreductase [Sphaerisporangium album]|uniref:LLM class flavin-dependent oxidoreductase n=1 Tax=Sphaerisporangium album TaxID=509200 RepID=A0A367FKH7_9ACTN|nr:LLM class flavin-dependent oxidoreductase [Sphaerisporangium album]RCG30399.1 LLM class flavin-dependent oxidoreductase [Sphaerisporangium album]